MSRLIAGTCAQSASQRTAGTITDRNGEPLAISTPVDSIWANPKELAPAVDDVPQLARVLGLNPQLLIRRITRSMDKEFLYLKRHISPDKAQQGAGAKVARY